MSGRAVRDPVLWVSGIVGVLGNVLGVVFLADIPGAYRLAQLDKWAAGVFAHPHAASASAVAFTLGLFALAVWAVALALRVQGGVARAGLGFLALGSLGNGVGTVTPLVLGLHVADAGPASVPLARALLGVTLTLDAAFNFTLGVGLLALGLGWHAAPRAWLKWLAIAAGLVSLPVAGQAFYDPAANLLPFAAPLWLGFILVTSLRRWSDE